MDIEKAKDQIRHLGKQGDRFMLALAILIRYTDTGFERFRPLTLPEGRSIYASFRRDDIERTCMEPDIHSYQFKDSDRVLYVNITQDIQTKKKLLRIVGRRLGHSATLVNELAEIVAGPSLDLSGI